MKRKLTQGTTLIQVLTSAKETTNKFLFALVAFVGLSLIVVSAHARGSELNISLWDHSPFEVEIGNDIYYTDCDLTLDNLAPGQHRIRVIKREQNCGYNGGRVSILFNGNVNIPRRSRVNATIHRNRSICIDDVQSFDQFGYGGNNGYGGHDGYGDYNHNPKPRPRPQRPGYGNEPYECNSGGFYSPFNDNVDCLDESDMRRLIRKMRNSAFDEDRLRIAKQEIRRTHISSDQARRLTEAFTFECNRLAFAKFAFDRTIDQENYFVVSDALTFNSSRRELEDYIYM